jgi:cyclic pyranopterin monophosphate synthase
MNQLTHLDSSGRANMVDIGSKPIQRRIALAEGDIDLNSATLVKINEALVKKGDVLTCAEIAGIQAAKRTSELIPLCHPLLTDHIQVEAQMRPEGVHVTAQVVCHGRTGAEMEALTAVSVALLTIYDMCKAVDKTMSINRIHLVRKEKQD